MKRSSGNVPSKIPPLSNLQNRNRTKSCFKQIGFNRPPSSFFHDPEIGRSWPRKTPFALNRHASRAGPYRTSAEGEKRTKQDLIDTRRPLTLHTVKKWDNYKEFKIFLKFYNEIFEKAYLVNFWTNYLLRVFQKFVQGPNLDPKYQKPKKSF